MQLAFLVKFCYGPANSGSVTERTLNQNIIPWSKKACQSCFWVVLLTSSILLHTSWALRGDNTGIIHLGSEDITGIIHLGSEDITGIIHLGSEDITGIIHLGSENIIGIIHLGSEDITGIIHLGSEDITGIIHLGSEDITGIISAIKWSIKYITNHLLQWIIRIHHWCCNA